MFTILRFIEFIAGKIPYPLLLKIGSGIGLWAFYLDKKHRNLAISNIIRAIRTNPAIARFIARESFGNFGKNIVEFLAGFKGESQVIGRENIILNKGNIFVIGHFGNWEVLGRVAVENGIRLSAVGRSIKNKAVDKYIKTKRFGSGLEILDKKGSFKYLLAALKDGRSVGILIDQYAGRRGVFVDFFGIPTSTIASPVLLAMRTDCPIVPAFIIREGTRQRVIVEEPIKLVKTGNISEDIKTNTQLMVKPLERYVRMYPEQWWWVHRRWR